MQLINLPNRIIRQISVIAMLLISFCVSAEENPVLNASKSVYRIISALNVTDSFPDSDRVKAEGYVAINFMGEQVVAFAYKSDIYLIGAHGTGFVISDGYLATNNHVVDDIVTGKHEGFVVEANGSGFGIKPLTVVYHNETKDMAVVKSDGVSGTPLPFAGESSIYQTAAVSSIGFPGDSDQASGGLGDLEGFLTPKIRKGILASPHTNQEMGIKVWEHDAAVSGGNSGGPLVNECGEVVGINTYVHNSNQSVLFAIAGSELISEIKARDIGFEQASSKCYVGDNGVSQNLIIMFFAALIALLVIFILFYLRLKRQVDKGTPPQTNSRLISAIVKKIREDSGELDKDPGGNVWKTDEHGRQYRYDSIKGMIFRDPKENITPTPVTPVEDSSVSVRVTVNGKEIISKRLAQGGSLSIGRSTGSDLRVDNSQVSSSHAIISCGETGITVQDLNSTNGTYISGQKVSGSQPVALGQKIHLVNTRSDYVIEVLSGVDHLQVTPSPKPGSLTLNPASKGALTAIHLEVGKLTSVGRVSSNDIVIDQGTVSRTHCYLKAHQDGTIVVEDNGSMNGIFVNDMNNRVKKATLKRGQMLYIGDKEIGYHFS